MSINCVVISGNLTHDAEGRKFQNGNCVVNFSVAVNESFKNSDGEWENRPNFVDCAIFGKRAEALKPHLVKGKKVSIMGKLRWSSWEAEGQKRSKLEVIVDEIEMDIPKSEKATSNSEAVLF